MKRFVVERAEKAMGSKLGVLAVLLVNSRDLPDGRRGSLDLLAGIFPLKASLGLLH